MEYAKGEGEDWRRELERWLVSHLGHTVFNPNKESKKYLQKRLPTGNLRRLKFSDIDRFQSIVKGIVMLDSLEIARRSSYIICYWDASAQRGAGTKGEVTIARFFGKPVYMVSRMKRSNIPGWVLGCMSETFCSFDELKLFLERKYAAKPSGRNSIHALERS